MKNAKGFTLIELVIVIVILGILGAVAAPKFFNLQGDAYAANIKAVQSSMETASTLVNTKAILVGKDKTGTELTATESGTGETVSIVNGYPAATEAGILKVLEISGTAVTDQDTATAATTPYVYTADTNADTNAKTMTIWPKARYKVNCNIVYKEVLTAGTRPEIKITDAACN